MSIKTALHYKDESLASFAHPEEAAHERFFTNTNDLGFRRLPWKSKRRGERTFDGKGREFATDNWFPVFISKEELEESSVSLMDARRAFRTMTDQFVRPGFHSFKLN